MDLHHTLTPHAALIGTWSGEGHGHYPTIADFTYTETITLTPLPGKPLLRYEQRTTGSDGAPLHTECGFWRFLGQDRLELTIAQPTGQTELLEGAISADGAVIELSSRQVANSSSAKQVESTARTYRWDAEDGTLHTSFSMAAAGQPMGEHLRSTLRQQP